ncbi:NADH dehydrogenase [ubiquinone] 1 alpha subcomplex subunit 7 [Apis mellifera caucasica]|uniref:NADH dehydrogenase [ubiquinone] 1 alpha subcomplex subunit 7 n=1 Tax=Apis mellifera TaxID=7460 RepID=A0A7M7FYR5_APIME|nr:NADH dehydrogenase [ubiquinone] 1 alpha subcomplex subunit 7 [Apis mellifera]KAG6800072.1 NADH dehydrogenase [ubiquinone] 1 alpha subcomplex subunit 7 [Apis mellifera caucasica]KAG9432201.1 NADH dehydrogenase [ubiquinone] 1 alpha subcomplex subunit 7 [Apis mellifera carnica]|eukprot:XP_001120056.1 NADH dehydrogenase [ubiquinone] 1 alpha subcomplex subunit 7 [Apis mellifera]
MPGIEHRSQTPFIQWLRDFGRGRKHVSSLRHADGIAARTQPPPHVPGGPYHKSSKVYYYTRDARRLVQPPIEIYTEGHLEAGKIDTTKIKLEALSKPQ